MKLKDMALFEKNQFRCVKTDSDTLNELIGGGLRTDNLIVVQAPAGCGKTTFLMRCTYRCLLAGEKVLYISGGEQDERELFERLGCMMCGVNYADFIAEYKEEDVEKIQKELEKYADLLEIVYSDDPFKCQNDGTVDMNKFLQLAKEQDIKFIVFDYLGAVMSETSDSQYAYLSTIAGKLKNYATTNHLCILTAMQTNREFKKALKEKNLDFTTLDETFMADSIGPARKASICITFCKVWVIDRYEYHIIVFKNRLNGRLDDINILVEGNTFRWID